MDTIRAVESKRGADASVRVVAQLAALAQETRLAIFRLLIEHASDGLTPGTVALKLKLAPATLSFHLKELAAAGLLTDGREGRFIWYRPDIDAMNRLMSYLTENCCRANGAACDTACAPAARVSSKLRRRSS